MAGNRLVRKHHARPVIDPRDARPEPGPRISKHEAANALYVERKGRRRKKPRRGRAEYPAVVA